MDQTATDIRCCGACGRRLAWWRSATWRFGVLHCQRCLTGRRLWVEASNLVVLLVVAAMVVGIMSLAGSIHFGAPADYDAPYMHPYVGAVTAWSKDESGLGGWIENQTDRDCPSMLVWVEAFQMDDLSPLLGPVAVTNGYVALGPLRAHQRMIWAGQRIDQWGHLAPLPTPPLADPSFVCYR